MNPTPIHIEAPEFGEAPRPGAGNDNPMELELRGYELARWDNGRWAQCSRYRPTDLGWRQAMGDGKWLQQRHPNERYQVRPIVSMKPPTPAPRQLDLSAPLTPAVPPGTALETE